MPITPEFLGRRRLDGTREDISAQPIVGVAIDQLVDQTAFARLTYQAQRANHPGLREIALGCPDSLELLDALGLTKHDQGGALLTMAGLLLIGTQKALHAHIPGHGHRFVVMQSIDVVDDSGPLAGPFFEIYDAFLRFVDARYAETEYLDGLFRRSVPNVSKRALREGFLNAFVHRRYGDLAPVLVRWINGDHVQVTSPGVFPAGMTPQTALFGAPHAVNPCLYNALNKLGLVESVGRGLDTVFADSARAGLPLPEVYQSPIGSVELSIPVAQNNLDFVRAVEALAQRGHELDTEEMLIFRHGFEGGHFSAGDIQHLSAGDIQHLTNPTRPNRAPDLLRKLVAKGAIDPIGSTRHMAYVLSASLTPVQAPNDPSQTTHQRVLGLAERQTAISRQHVVEALGLSPAQASYVLRQMKQAGLVEQTGKNRGARYRITPAGRAKLTGE